MLTYMTICQVFVLVALTSPLNADNYSNCEPEVKVCCHTVYQVFIGQELKIACPVHFCNNYVPTITWVKLDETEEDIETSDRIKTEWKKIKHGEGIAFLSFQNALSSDSGIYQCQSGPTINHTINVSVVCQVETKACSNQVYIATTGEQLKIACPVDFCDSLAPTITWFKQVTDHYISVNMSERVSTEWIELNKYEGISVLVFQNIFSSDAGQYQCRSTDSVSHTIKVYVNAVDTKAEAEPGSWTLWSFVFRLIGVIAFFVTVTTVYIIITKRKRVQRPTSSPMTVIYTNQRNQASPQTIHIYDNDA